MNKKIRTLAIILGGVFAAATVFFAVEQSAKGAELAFIEQKSDKLVQENSELSSNLIMSSSLSKVAETASGSGLVKPDKIVYLNSQVGVVAKLP